MRLLAIDAAHFAGLRIRERLEFAPGLNIIAAPNQAGKTTLLTMLEWALYGVPASGTRRSIQEVERLAPWDGGQPGATLDLAPGQTGWPEAMRLDVRFADFQLYLTDLANLANITERVQLNKNGTWDLGQSLLGLRREAFSCSLLALQGELEDVLLSEPFIRVLTADLAELVEDPDRARLDSARALVEQPRFTCPGLRDTAVLLPNLLRDAEKNAADCASRAVKLEQLYASIEELLQRKEQAEQALAERRARLNTLEAQSEQYNLAAAHWRFSLVHRYQESLRAWEVRLQQAPFLDRIPPELPDAVQRWQGERVQAQRELDRIKAKLDQARYRLSTVEEQLRQDEPSLPLLDHQGELSRQALALEVANKEIATAQWKLKEYGEGAEPSARARFNELDDKLRPHREYIPDVMRWMEEDAALAKALAATRERQSELKGQTKHRSPLITAGALVLVLGSLLTLIVGAVSDKLLPGLAGFVVLAGAGVWLAVRAMQQRRLVDRAQVELNTAVEPKLAELTGQHSRSGAARLELQARHGLSDEAWSQLTYALPEYQPLLLMLQNYANATRDEEDAKQRVGAAWAAVRAINADAPVRPDAEWLARLLAKLDAVKQRQRERIDVFASVKDCERELQEAERSLQAFAAKLGQLLAPLGLQSKAEADPALALKQYEALLREARELQAGRELLATAEEQARAIPMSREDYERRIGTLASPQLLAITQLVKSEDDFANQVRKRRALQDEIVTQRQELQRGQTEISRLRELVAKDEDALLSLPEAQLEQRQAAQRLQTVQRWQHALELLRDLLAGVQRDLSSKLAPAVNAELSEVLRYMPVHGVVGAALADNLELRLRVEGAPPGLDGRELVARLSTGARRQLALALRIALAAALGAERNAPLLLDEPLAELDDDHALSSFSYLAQTAANRQVLLTTCHGEQLTWLLAQAGVQARLLNLA